MLMPKDIKGIPITSETSGITTGIPGHSCHHKGISGNHLSPDAVKCHLISIVTLDCHSRLSVFVTLDVVIAVGRPLLLD